jgi:hypothetical protein
MYKMDVTIEDTEHRVYLYARDNDGELSVVPERKAFVSREKLIQSL